jgi:hypothetical protein
LLLTPGGLARLEVFPKNNGMKLKMFIKNTRKGAWRQGELEKGFHFPLASFPRIGLQLAMVFVREFGGRVLSFWPFLSRIAWWASG